jgi:hypothetical protein
VLGKCGSGLVGETGAGGSRPAAGGDEGLARGNELSGTVHGPVVQARSIYGDVHFHEGSPVPVPDQMPAVPANFTNRRAELAGLTTFLGRAEPPRPVTLAVIMGVGGAGKTSLALRWLSEVGDRFPAGQLYADLGGHLAGSVVRPAEVLGQFLRAFGLAPGRVPVELGEAAALWRSVTSGRPLAVLLDNSASAAQVRAVCRVRGRAWWW